MRIPASLRDPAAGERRRSRRSALAAVNDREGIDFVVVTDLSPEGARIVTPVPLQVGREVALKLPLMEPVDATIVWVSSRIAGCRFADPLHPALLRVLIATAH